MPAPLQPKLPKINVRIDCDKFFLRTLKPDDACERWAGWMADRRSVRLLNVPAKVMSQQDVAAYIKQFDQRSSLLIGIFEKPTRSPIGIIRLDIAHAFSRALGFMFIGEGRFRHSSVIDAPGLRFQDYVFDTLGLRTLLTTVLARNRAMVLYLVKHGWTLDETIERHVKSQTDDTMLDLCFLSLSGDAWHPNPPGLSQFSDSPGNSPPADRARGRWRRSPRMRLYRIADNGAPTDRPIDSAPVDRRANAGRRGRGVQARDGRMIPQAALRPWRLQDSPDARS